MRFSVAPPGDLHGGSLLRPRLAVMPLPLYLAGWPFRQDVERPLDMSAQFLAAVEEQYASLYLQSIGASNSEANL